MAKLFATPPIEDFRASRNYLQLLEFMAKLFTPPIEDFRVPLIAKKENYKERETPEERDWPKEIQLREERKRCPKLCCFQRIHDRDQARFPSNCGGKERQKLGPLFGFLVSFDFSDKFGGKRLNE